MSKKNLPFKPFLSLLLCIVFLSCCLCGCNKSESAVQGVTFTDALGRNVTVSRNPKRTAALVGSFADVWLLAGGSLCAAPKDAEEDFGIDMTDVINIGGAHSPNAELLLSANPDFVIASASTAADTELLSLLTSSGITVAYFDVDCFDDYLEMLSVCTDITGRKDLYEKNGTEVKKQVTIVKEKIKNSTLSAQEQSVLLLRASSGSVKAKGSSGTILGEMLKDIGLKNIADSDTSLLESLSAESVIKQNPYRIFIVTMGDDTQAAEKNIDKLIKENPAWSTLEAVKNGRVHYMDKKLFNLKPNARWGLAYEKLSEIILQ